MTNKKPLELVTEELEERKKRRQFTAKRRAAEVAVKAAEELEDIRGEQHRLRAEFYARREAKQ